MNNAISRSKPSDSHDSWLDKPLFPWWSFLTIEKFLIFVIIALTVISRFYDIGARTMSHDEVNHVVPAYTLENYVYDPVTHGPFQFHALAFSYFLFGDSDTSARIPAAMFGIAVVVFTIVAWRRYLGRVGALVGGLFFMISPYVLFYSRYTRNEIFIVFWGLVMLWLFLRYLEDGKTSILYWLTLIVALHFVDKATSYIFSAEALIFLALLFVYEAVRKQWKSETYRKLFSVAFAATLLFGVITLGLYFLNKGDPTSETGSITVKLLILMGVVLTLISALRAVMYLISGLGMPAIRRMRSFDLIVLLLLLVLPLLAALPIQILGFDPLDYSQTGILRSASAFVLLGLISTLLGALWDKKTWLRCALIFWSVFIIFYTTFFVHGEGFFKGLVAALGYWMSQQTVQRGTQPLYYYAAVQIPIYEFMPAIGTIMTFVIASIKGLFSQQPQSPFLRPEKFAENQITCEEDNSNLDSTQVSTRFFTLLLDPLSVTGGYDLGDDSEIFPTTDDDPRRWYEKWFSAPERDDKPAKGIPTVALLLYWSVMSLIAFSLAGERMPWLTTHITMPLILSAAWGVAFLIERIHWRDVWHKKGALVIVVMGFFMASFGSLLHSILGTTPPFQGKELVQLEATSTFMLASIGSGVSLAGLYHLLKEWNHKTFAKLLLLVCFVVMSVFTFRAAYRAAYINYDNAKEFLVYAHSTRDMKDVLEQVETISKRLYGDKSINVAYDNDSLYPFWWYFRDYPNKRWYGDNITKDLQESPIILAGSKNFAKIEPVVADDYYTYEYKRMWWPTEAYRNQTFKTVWDMIKQPAMRSALWQIWFNRDYKEYANVTGDGSLTLATWSPADTLRMYVRKDVAAKIWEFGFTPEPEEPKIDPYASNTISLDPESVIDIAGDIPFSAPRGIAIAPDGSIYVADSRNHRIVHLDSNGLYINAWGAYANVLEGPAPEGYFNEPWGVAVGPDGKVFVTDTWNHRIQVFDADGTFIRMWSEFSVSGTIDNFWGPRGIVVDRSGRVYVTDTGKQRVVIFDSEGNYLSQFGGRGFSPGQLDEPVGIALDASGNIYIADTWNNRVQVFAPNEVHTIFTSILSWDIDGWNTDTLDNKPFIAVSPQNEIFVTDPDMGRIIRFDSQGSFLQLWGGYQNSYLMGVISGIAAGDDGRIWVSDALNNNLLSFIPPAVP